MTYRLSARGLVFGLVVALLSTTALAQKRGGAQGSESDARSGGAKGSERSAGRGTTHRDGPDERSTGPLLEVKRVTKGVPLKSLAEVLQVPVNIVWLAKLRDDVELKSIRFDLTTANTDGSTTQANETLNQLDSSSGDVTITIPMRRGVFAKSYEIILVGEFTSKKNGGQRFSKVFKVSGDFPNVTDK
jgi:hypothetical protein